LPIVAAKDSWTQQEEHGCGVERNGVARATYSGHLPPCGGGRLARCARKPGGRGGHLVSKHRFVAAQLDAYLTDDLWLTLARHANAMADPLAGRLAAAGYLAVWPVEANEVFVKFPRDLDRRLKQAGASYHPWATDSLPAGVAVAPDEVLVRLVTSFATRAEDIEEFVGVILKA
jgi:threonine aldolase